MSPRPWFVGPDHARPAHALGPAELYSEIYPNLRVPLSMGSKMTAILFSLDHSISRCSSTMPPKKRSSDAGADTPPPAKLNRTDTDYSSMPLANGSQTKTGGKKWNFKITTWNVDGLRAWIKKNGLDFFTHEKPDVICLQETKCSEAKLPDEIKHLKGYSHQYWLAAQKEGYSGVALLSQTKPVAVTYGLQNKEMDDEGRVITAEFDSFFVVTTYVPNAGRKLVTLDKRMRWDPLLKAHLQALDAQKPVILCGDLNVAHLEIDLANPKTNKKSAGFTKEERDGFSDLLKEDFVDTFRHFYPDKEKCYTFWTYMMGARAKNVGWRLDYFVVSKRFVDSNICDNAIRSEVFGSDHCPSTLFLVK
ncbi:hypothetical protein TCAL_02487 [Tigriopus californicus]|uniref:DNA-(apurinic or apyrimidinic site) endonuclease n=2 Tax=Tigriopus californicus TaxID=6832 RepID=A0A553NSU3_TIGCA|nr:hypothetical protein TCAL_02487 [Tigriopus californicus]